MFDKCTGIKVKHLESNLDNCFGLANLMFSWDYAALPIEYLLLKALVISESTVAPPVGGPW